MRDLNFISGNFLDYEIPKDKKYLLKYFKNDLQLAFLRYYLVFGTRKNFTDHTGHKCAESLQKKLEKRCQNLIELYDKSKSSFTEEGLKVMQLIESGKFKFTAFKKPKDE
jgi:hypothetical protein